MGLESPEDYTRELHLVEDLIVEAVMKVSTLQGDIDTSARNQLAVQLYARMTITAMTLMRLLPLNRVTRDTIPHWDWPSVASITRNIIETYLLFFYVGLEAISAKEDEFRRLLLNYHHNWEKYRLYKDWSVKKEVLAEFEQRLPEARRGLEAHEFFLRLTRKQKNDVIRGRVAMYLTRDDLVARLPFDGTEIRPFYRLLSNQVHTTPFSFQSNSNERGRGMENVAERGYIILGSSLARKYLAAAVVGMAQLFPKDIGDRAVDAVALAREQFAEFTKSKDSEEQ